jgi:hypothetical protein
MAGKPKRTKRPTAKKKATKAKPRAAKPKKSDNRFMLIILALLVIAALYIFLQKPDETPEGIALSNCMFSLSSNTLDCNIDYNGESCDGDVIVTVWDDMNRTMIAVDSDSFGMGYVEMGQKLSAVLVNIPGEDPIEADSACAGAILACGETVYQSSCIFV